MSDGCGQQHRQGLYLDLTKEYKMGLRIRTNIASVAVQKNLRQSDAKSSDSYEKLASGKQITKSADDAAGLGIAKKMEAEVAGYRMAQRNANNAISLVQVAEGGLNETGSVLTRLRELSIQAASDTVGEIERGYLNLEYDHLVQEADRIAKTTTFSGSGANNKFIVSTTFATGVANGALTEAGIFAGSNMTGISEVSTTNRMFNRTTFAVINKSSSFQLTIQWTIEIGALTA